MSNFNIQPTPGKKLILADLLTAHNLKIAEGSEVTADWTLYNENGEADATLNFLVEVGDVTNGRS